MGAFLDKPKTEKTCHVGSSDEAGLRYCVSSMQGWRVDMEDSHEIRIGLNGLEDWCFFAVFDGHAGSKVAKHCASSLLNAILQTNEFQELIAHRKGSTSSDAIENDLVRRGIRNGFLALDEEMRSMPDVHGSEERSGSTAVCVFISPTHLYFANLGDSRAVMSKSGALLFSTEDHKPFNPKERDRIVNAGGSVMIQRVNGSLAVSRALGDYEYKCVAGRGPCEQLVSPEPDIYALERTLREDEFILLACDGIYDVMSNQEVVDFVRFRLTATNNLSVICSEVIDACLSKGSRDNMSVILIALGGAPTPSKAAIDADQELRLQLEKRIGDVLAVCDSVQETTTDHVLKALCRQEIPGVPPGAGIHAMRDLVESVLQRLKADYALSEKQRDELFSTGLMSTADQLGPINFEPSHGELSQQAKS